MISVVLGRRGYGKTTYIKKELLPRAGGRVLLFDTLGEYGDVVSSFTTLETFIAAVYQKQQTLFRLAFVPISEDLNFAFSYFCRIAWALGDLTMVIDEVDIVTSPVSVPEEFSKIIRYGRHRSISVIAASRRAAEVPRILTSQADEIVSFNQSEPNDVDYLKKYVGADLAQQVYRLPKYSFVRWTPGDTIPLDTEKPPPVE